MNWNKIVIQDNGCWLWTGAIGADGYGRTGWKGKTVLVHRLVWEEFIGPIQHTLDHVKERCSEKACCNPEHLEDVTLSENRLRAKKNRDLCPQGHQYTRRRTDRGGTQGRICQTCVSAANRRWKQRQKEKV